MNLSAYAFFILSSVNKYIYILINDNQNSINNYFVLFLYSNVFLVKISPDPHNINSFKIPSRQRF